MKYVIQLGIYLLLIFLVVVGYLFQLQYKGGKTVPTIQSGGGYGSIQKLQPGNAPSTTLCTPYSQKYHLPLISSAKQSHDAPSYQHVPPFHKNNTTLSKQDELHTPIQFTYQYLRTHWNYLLLVFTYMLNQRLQNTLLQPHHSSFLSSWNKYLGGDEWLLTPYEWMAFQASGCSRPDKPSHLFLWRRRRKREQQQTKKDKIPMKHIPAKYKISIQRILQSIYRSLFNSYPYVLQWYSYIGWNQTSEQSFYSNTQTKNTNNRNDELYETIVVRLYPHMWYQMDQYESPLPKKLQTQSTDMYFCFRSSTNQLDSVGCVDSRYFGEYNGLDTYFPTYSAWDRSSDYLSQSISPSSFLQRDPILSQSITRHFKPIIDQILDGMQKTSSSSSQSSTRFIERLSESSNHFNQKKGQYKTYQCIGLEQNPNETHRQTGSLCRLGGGIWDRPCRNDSDCPYFQSNQNYPNSFGGCNKTTGQCQMPKYVERIGYRYPKYPERIQFHNCNLPSETLGCPSQKADIMFTGDRQQRRQYRTHLERKGLHV